MGSWGTGIYSNDTACDVRDTCSEVYPLVDISRAREIIFREFDEIIREDTIDNDTASFWYALADWQWKHGIDDGEVKEKAIALLREHAGIEELEEDASPADVRKRIAALDALRERLESPMPTLKIPKVRLAKPKHKPGDIFIIRTCDRKEDPDLSSCWDIESVYWGMRFKDERLSNMPVRLSPIIDGHGKYFAVLCIGSTKIEHSCYVPDVYDEYSTYVCYNYFSEECPSIDELKRSGFLPYCDLEWLDFNRRITSHFYWTYLFTLEMCTFKPDKWQNEDYCCKHYEPDEAERFYSLWSKRKYSSEVYRRDDAQSVFGANLEYKLVLERMGVPFDDLLDGSSENPEFVSGEVYDKRFKAQMKLEVQDILKNADD